MGYRAFFSYARVDDKIANWLWGVLDRYRTPKDLIGAKGKLGPVPDKLHKIFRDRTDLGSGGHVSEELQAALESSERLIVLCTPASAKSFWVNHEVETFQKLGRADRIFPVIGAGAPDSGDPETECFPPALRGKGILAADLREIKLPTGQLIGDGREGGRLKLVAGLLGVDLDALARRERRRQRILAGVLGAAALAFLGVAALAGVQTLAERAQRERADKKTVEAERSLKLANEKAEAERKARESAMRFARERDAKTLEAITNLREAERQEGFASENAKQALNTLHRFFATRAWEKHKTGDYLAAARYALAGMQVSPANEELFRAVLGSAMHEAGESRSPMMHAGPVTSAVFSPDGRSIVTTSIDRTAKVWSANNGALTAVLEGHTNDVLSAAFSPDGTHIVTAGGDNTAKVWNAIDGALISTLSGHGLRVHRALFSPDGTRIVTASGDKTAKVWSVSDGRLITTLSEHTGSLYSAAFSPDGGRIITASGDKTAKVWNSDGALIATLAGHGDAVISAAFSPDGGRIVTASGDSTAKVWSADGALIATLAGHGDSVISAAFSPDGTRIVTASGDSKAKVWSADGALIVTLAGHRKGLNSAAFSLDGTRIVTSSDDSTAKVWSADGVLIATLAGHESAVLSAAFGPDGVRIVTAGWDLAAKVWDHTEGALTATLFEHGGPVLSAVFSPDEKRIITRGVGKSIFERSFKIWDLSDGPKIAAQGQSDSVVFSPDGRRFLTASSDKTAKVWDANTGALSATLSGHGDAVTSAAFSPDGQRIVTASLDKTAKIWDASNGALLVTLSGHLDAVTGAAFSPDGQRIVTASIGRVAKIWNTGDGTPIATMDWYEGATRSRLARIAVRSLPDLSVAFSPDGVRLITASFGNASKVWRVSDGRLLAALEERGNIIPPRIFSSIPDVSAAFSPDGARIVTASGDNTAKVWDANTGALSATLSGHGDAVTSAAFSPDGQRIVTASLDKTAKIWDARSGVLLASLSGHSDAVIGAAFSPNGRLVVTASDDKTAKIWDVRRLVQPWGELARDACQHHLGPRGRLFFQAEINVDQLLISEWPNASRDVCEGVAGVLPIVELRRSAGLLADPPATPEVDSRI